MKLVDIRAKIDNYFDNISPEEFYKTLIKYHMRTIFKGTINGKEFDNVQDYNTEMQRLLAAGENIQAESHTETAPEPVDESVLFPGFAHCQSIDTLDEAFIDAALEMDADEFMNDVNNLFHDKIKPAITEMNRASKENYKNLVGGIREHLKKLHDESDAKATVTVKRLEEIEKELEDLKAAAENETERCAVIEFVDSLYESIEAAIGNVYPDDGPADELPEREDVKSETVGSTYVEEIKRKARELFGI